MANLFYERFDSNIKLYFFFIISFLIGILVASPLFMMIFIIVSPNSMGVEISRKSTSIDNILAIGALLARSPLYLSPMIHRLGLFLGILSFISGITISIVFKDYSFVNNRYSFFKSAEILIYWGPIAYLFTTLSMFIIELIYSFCEMSRAIQSQSKNNRP
jgi:hypothetical protein